jgi:hypothetical protein
MLMAIEEHGAGKQLVRLRTWPRCSLVGLVVILLLAALSGAAALDHAWVVSAILGVIAALLVLRMLWECAAATATTSRPLEKPRGKAALPAGAVRQPSTQE